MKKVKLILSIFMALMLINACKPTVDPPSTDPGTQPGTQPCTTTCQNGGQVNANCGCNCPEGYTGTYCQTKVTTTATASINPNTVHQLCPAWYSGDDDYGGYLSVDWSVQLFMTSNNTKVYAKVYANFVEYSSTGNTKAWIDPSLASNQILLYTVPAGKKITSINSPTYYGRTDYPSGNFHGTNSITVTDNNSFLNKLEFIGDTDGPDLPCDGSTERSRFRVYFKSFNLTLVNQ